MVESHQFSCEGVSCIGNRDPISQSWRSTGNRRIPGLVPKDARARRQHHACMQNTTDTTHKPVSGRPQPDMQAVAHGDAKALVLATAALAAALFRHADSSIRFPASAVDVASKEGPKAGMLAAAIDLRALLAQSPQGRQALADFGFEPVLHHVESE